MILESAKNINKSMKSAVFGNLMINIFLQGSLQAMWSMINTLQLTLHMPCINVSTPTNVSFFSSLLIGVTQFDILPESILRYFYLWNLADGTYASEGEEEESEGSESTRRLLESSASSSSEENTET